MNRPEPGRARVPLGAVLAAYLVSVSCTAVSAIAIPWLVLSTTGSATRTGLVVLAEMAPYVVMQAVAGPWVERFGPRRASWTANLLAGLTLLLVPALHVVGALGYPSLVAVVAVVGALRGIADCGSAPMVPGTARLAGTPLERAAGLHSSSTQAGQLLGAPIAAVLLSFVPPPLVLVVSGTGFLLAGIGIRLLVPASVGRARAAEPGESYLRRVGEGLRFLFGEPVLRALIVMIAATNLLSAGLVSVLLPSWVRAHELPVAAIGTVAAGFGIGALCGSLIGAWVAPRVNRWLVYAVGFLIGAAPMFLGLALSRSVVPAVVVAVLCGLAGGGINPVVGAVQYERIPAPILPRALGAVKAIAWIGVPLGPLLAGVLTDALGIVSALMVLAAAAFVLTLGPFVVPSFRQLGHRPG